MFKSVDLSDPPGFRLSGARFRFSASMSLFKQYKGIISQRRFLILGKRAVFKMEMLYCTNKTATNLGKAYVEICAPKCT